MGMLGNLPGKSSWKKWRLSPILKDEAEFSKKDRGRGYVLQVEGAAQAKAQLQETE